MHTQPYTTTTEAASIVETSSPGAEPRRNGTELVTVREFLLVGSGGYDLEVEDEFVQAGVELVDIGRRAFIALGELLSWKIRREQAEDSAESINAIITRYAAEWGVSKGNLMKSWVNVSRFPGVERPAEASNTTCYEVLSGAKSEADAEAGMQTVASEGYGAAQVREAKALRENGVLGEGEWKLPQLKQSEDGNMIIAVRDGKESIVATRVRDSDELADIGWAQLIRRL